MSESSENVGQSCQYTTQQQICRYYVSYGWCKFGTRCNFLHVYGGGVPTPWTGNYLVNSQSYAQNKGFTSCPQVGACNYLHHYNDIKQFSGTYEGQGHEPFHRSSIGHQVTELGHANSTFNEPWQPGMSAGVHSQAWPPEKDAPLSWQRDGREHERCTSTSREERSHRRLPFDLSFNWRIGRTDVARESGKDVSKARDEVRSRPVKPCKYYMEGYCRSGNRCHYLHSEDLLSSSQSKTGIDCTEVPAADVAVSTESNSEVMGSLQELERVNIVCEQPRVVVKKQALLISDVTQEQLTDLRNVEISQLKKRFQPPNLEEVSSGLGGTSKFIVTLSPTDPDWIFDVREVKLDVRIPDNYPKEACLDTEVRQENNELLPLILIRHLSVSIQQWFKSTYDDNIASGKVELVFRPFLRWFDRNMEDLFVAGLKKVKRNLEAEAAGIQFVPFKELQNSHPVTSETKPEVTQCDGTGLSSQLENVSLSDGRPSDIESKSATHSSSKGGLMPSSESSDSKRRTNDFKVQTKGTEILLRNLQLGENVATLICQRLRVTIECWRCKTRHDVATDAKKRVSMPCTKCHNNQQLIFNSSLMHQHSAVMGYLDLEGCTAFDLPIVECGFLIECFGCNKQMSSEGIHYGQPFDFWCRVCNSKMSIFVDSAKFHLIRHNSAIGKRPIQLIKLDKKEKRTQGPAIQEGKPLPGNGICRHYKKSFRWFRFPCCGKAYPCDLCHNEKEVEHEMKFATRIICGFCAKEQPFSSMRPCAACGSSFSHSGKGHWEGGKGCRDKNKMSRDDSHKYSGINKTISRKTKELQEKCKKKKSA